MKKVILAIWAFFAGEMALIERQSKNALGTFQTVVDDLKATEAKIQSVIKKKQDAISELTRHREVLEATKVANAKIQSKINEFLHGS